MTPKLIAAALTLTGLAACAPPPPTVTAFNGDSVELQTIPAQPFPTVQTNAEADRICSKAGKNAEYASSRNIRTGHMHLYLCLAPPPQVTQAPMAPQPIYPGQPVVVIR